MMEETDILPLIERYLEGQTTLDEERRLRDALLHTDSDHPSVTEAKALMAYMDMASHFPRRQSSGGGVTKFRITSRIWQMAASVAILTAIGIGVIRFGGSDSHCYTMIACVEDSSSKKAFDLIGSQLQAVGEASDEVTSDLFGSLSILPE